MILRRSTLRVLSALARRLVSGSVSGSVLAGLVLVGLLGTAAAADQVMTTAGADNRVPDATAPAAVPAAPAPAPAPAAPATSTRKRANRRSPAPDPTAELVDRSTSDMVVFELGESAHRAPAPVVQDPLADPAFAPLARVAATEDAQDAGEPPVEDPSLYRLLALADPAFARDPEHIVVLPLAPVTADTPDDARESIDTITLGDLVNRAAFHSEDLRADRAALDSAKDVARSSLAGFGPRVDFRYDKGHEHSFLSTTTTPPTHPGHVRADITDSLVQPLIDPAAAAGYARDTELARAAEARRRATEVSVSFEAAGTYFDLIEARLTLDLARAHKQRMAQLVSYMTKRAALGGASDADLERVKAVALSARRAEIDARGALDVAMSALHRITGVTAVQVAVPDRVNPQLPEQADTAFALMVKRNPELRAAFIQIKAAHDDALAVAARLSPKISLEVGRYQSQNASGAQGTTVDSRVMLVGAMGFGAGTELFQVRAQNAHVTELKHRYAALLRNARERLQASYLSRQNIEDQRIVAWQEYSANAKVAAAFDEQLFSANRSLLDVLDTYQKFFQSKINIVPLTISEIKTSYQIKQLIGDLNRDTVADNFEN